MMMDIKINRDSVIPIYTQIYNTIRAMILTGALPAGYKLPPERKLAEQLGVNRSTVLNAYRELKAIGLIESHIGQGTTVADFRYGEPVADDYGYMTGMRKPIYDDEGDGVSYGIKPAGESWSGVSADCRRPAGCGGMTAAGIRPPIAGGGPPIAGGMIPIAGEGSQNVGGRSPIARDGTPIAGGKASIADGESQIAGVGASLADGKMPKADGRMSMTDARVPVVGVRAPIAGEGPSIAYGMEPTKEGRMSMAGGTYGVFNGSRGSMTSGREPMAEGKYGRVYGGRMPTSVPSGRITSDVVYKNSPIPPMPWDQLFSESSMRMQDTTVRDLLRLSGRKDMILFAAGVTVPGIDSLEALRRIQMDVIKSHGHTAVEHMPADGFYPLRESITRLMSDRGINASAAETMVLSGSQQGLDLVARAFIDPGDVVFVEEPTFFSAIHIFRSAGARVVGVPTDYNGMRTDVLSMLLKRFKPKLIYTIPDFQNPSGAVMSIERRNELLWLAYRNQIIILEDDPYGRLRYEGNAIPALKAMDVHGNVLYLSTFSKLLFPGFRVGWISGPPQVLYRLTLLKQTADLHTSSLPQLIFDQFLREGLMKGHLEKTIEENRRRRDIMLEELTAAGLEGLSWNKPEGGLYLWCSIPDSMPQSRLLSRAVDNGVSFVPGKTFYPGNASGNYIRLNFTYPAPEQIKEGVRRLARAYNDVLREHKNDAAEMDNALGLIL
jgi:DNA-binding transcriptional MocR family regulator